MKRKKMAEDEGTAELSCYMMKVIDDLMAGKKYRQCIPISVRCVLLSGFPAAEM